MLLWFVKGWNQQNSDLFFYKMKVSSNEKLSITIELNEKFQFYTYKYTY